MSTHVVLLVCVWALVSHQCDGKEYVDLSYDFGEDTATWPTSIPFTRDTVARGYTPSNYWYESYKFCMNEHSGTHLDAPSHFAEGKWAVDDIPLSHLMGPGVVIDMRDKVTKDPNAELTTGDLMSWLDEHGPLPDGVIVLVRTGWASRYGNKTQYFGTDTDDTSNLIFPGISNGAAQLLVGYEAVSGHKVVGIGLDTPSLDHGPSKDFKSHQTLSEANIYGLENVANLDKLPTKGFDVLVMPMKIRGGSGAPARVLATLPGANSAPSSVAILGTPLLLVSVIAYHLCQML